MERLSRQLDRQKRFLDNAAHQLRTPLAIMKTQLGYATRRPQSEELATVLTEVDSNLTNLARLTNQLLTLGRVEHERDGLEVELVDLSEVARDVVAEAAPRALDRKIDLAFDSNGVCKVVATTMLLREMVSNLVDNAIQHAGPGASATVSVRQSERVAAITVEDNGVGFDESDRASLFERFGRGRNAHSGGSGLGLSIVAEIIEMFGGTIELPTPAGGDGFCIVVRLPLAEVA